jgi:hypothetical protein
MRVRWQLQRIYVAIASLVAVSPSLAGPEPEAARGTLPLIEPTIVQYRWTFVEPVWIVPSRSVDVRIVDPATRRKRIDYDTVEITFERKRVGRVPEFSCKYADFAWPNECRTTWRTVYADVPVPIVRRDHVDVEVPGRWRDARVVDEPRLRWKRRELVVSMPATASYKDPLPVVPTPQAMTQPAQARQLVSSSPSSAPTRSAIRLQRRYDRPSTGFRSSKRGHIDAGKVAHLGHAQVGFHRRWRAGAARALRACAACRGS